MLTPQTTYPLSSKQREIWLNQLLYPDTPLYNIGGGWQIYGHIELDKLTQALQQVAADHDALRLVLVEDYPLPQQTLVEADQLTIEFHDFSTYPNSQPQALQWMQEEFAKPFSPLYHRPLFQFALLKVAKQSYFWFGKCHHLAIDGWGIALLMRQVAAAYLALLTEQPWYGEQFSYLEFVEDEVAYLNSDHYQQDQHYWLNKYSTLPAPLLSRKYANHLGSQYTLVPSRRTTLCLAPLLYQQLTTFAKEHQVSLFHLLLALLYSYLVRTTGISDLVIGLPLLNRHTAAFKQTIGMFTGIMPARFQFGNHLNFIDLMQQLSTQLRQDYRHQRFPLYDLNRLLGLPPTGRSQLLEVILSYEDYHCSPTFTNHPAIPITISAGLDPHLLAIHVREYQEHNEVRIDFDYNLASYNQVDIELLKARFACLLHEILRHPNSHIWELNLLPHSERYQILRDFNRTVLYPLDRTVVALFEAQVARTPANIAVVWQSQSLTYAQLNSAANQLAYYLRQLGVQPEWLVAICVERSLAIIIAIWGVLKAGAAYLPIDPTAATTSQVEWMLTDAAVAIILTCELAPFQATLNLTKTNRVIPVVYLDTDWEQIAKQPTNNPLPKVGLHNLAYLVYTANTTGQATGVMITHGNYYQIYQSWEVAYHLHQYRSRLQLTSLASERFSGDLVKALCAGAKLVLAPLDWLTRPAQLYTLVLQEDIDSIEVEPAALVALTTYLIKTQQTISSLKLLVLVSDSLKLSEYVKFKSCYGPSIHLVNSYGVTETSINNSYFEHTYLPVENLVPIGRPLPNNQFYILDAHWQPVPIGVTGELYLGGAGLARGYLNQPALTAEKFIQTLPAYFKSLGVSRLYKTGKLARYLADGTVELLG